MDEEKKKSPKPRSFIRKLAGWTAVFLGGLFILFALAVSGLILWLRQPAGEARLKRILNEHLADVGGYSVTLGKAAGTLPGRVYASDIVVADKDGPFFKAAELELLLDFMALGGRVAHIPLARVSGPELLRLPAPAADPSPPQQGPTALPDLTLPLAVKVDKILVENAGVALQALTGGSPLPAPPGRLGPLPARLAADLSGSASILNGKLAAALELHVSTDSGHKASLAADASMGGGQAAVEARGAVSAPLHAPGDQAAHDGQGPQDRSLQEHSAQGAENMELAYALKAVMDGSVITVHTLQLGGMGINLNAQSAVIGLDSGDISARAGLTIEDQGLWRSLAADLAGLRPEQLAGISASLGAQIDKDGRSEAEHLKVDLKAAIKDLGPLSGQVSGPLAAAVSIEGQIDELLTRVDLSSVKLTTAGGVVEGLSASLNAAYSQTPDGGMAAKGDFKLSTAKSPGGPGQATASFAVDLPQNAVGAAALEKLNVDFAGALLSGDLKASIPQDKDPQSMRLDGKLRAEIKSWAVIAALSGQDIKGGPLRLSCDFNAADGQNADLALTLDSLALPGVSLSGARLEARGSRILTAPALRARLNAGAGQAGPLKWSAASAAVDGAKSGAFNLALNAGKGELLALGGNYNLDKSEAALTRFVFNLPEYKAGARLTAPLRLNYADGLKAQGLRAAFTPGGTLEASADIKPEAMSVEARLAAFPLSFLKNFSDAPLPEGEVNAQISYAASGGAPRGKINVKSRMAMPARGGKGQNINLQLDAAVERGRGGPQLRGAGAIDIDGNAANGAKLAFAVPLVMNGAAPAPDPRGRLSASFKIDSPLAPLWRFVPLPGRTLDGRLRVDLALAGTMGKPEVKGTAYLAGGRFEDKLNGVLLRDMALEAHGTPEGGRLLFSAADGRGGSLALQGAVKLGAEPTLDARGQIRRLRPLHRNDLSIMLSGLLNVKGPLASPLIEADIIVDRGEVLLLSSLGAGGGVTTLNISEAGDAMRAKTAGPPCNLRIEIPRRFFIRGRGLDSEWQGKLRVTGDLSQPVLVGALNPVRGSLELLSKSFVFTKGDITFAGGDRINPGLDLELTYTGPDITALVNVGGSAQKPVLKLSSRPQVAQDEVLSRILFGKSPSELSQFETIQLANGIRELATGGGGMLDPLGSVRKATGLDVLRVGGGQTKSASGPTGSDMSGAERPIGSNKQENTSTGPSLEAGKYINDRIYVGMEQGATPESTGVRVEIELSPSIKLQGKTAPKSSQVGIGWKKDY